MNLADLTPVAHVPVSPEEEAALSMLRAACIDAAGSHGSEYLGAVSSALGLLARGHLADAQRTLHEFALSLALRGHIRTTTETP